MMRIFRRELSIFAGRKHLLLNFFVVNLNMFSNPGPFLRALLSI